jgi:hypothetical protein
MPDNERTGVESCLADAQFRDMLKNHSADTDRGYISSELDRIRIVFDNDNGGSKRKAVIDYIVEIKWSELEGLETALRTADGLLQPLMG